MLNQLFSESLALAAAQVVLVILLSVGVVLVARRHAIHLGAEVAISLTRGLVQIVTVGSVLVLLLQGPDWTSVFVLVAMVFSAAALSAQRSQGLADAFRVSLWSIGFGAGVVILLMTWAGVIESSITSLVPIGSMIIANAMNSNALALDRFRAEVESHTGQIEAGLALGADPRKVVLPYAQSAVRASLIPRIDALRSLGIVWIPGVMAGMLLQGANPVYAAVYQFVVIAMISSSSGLTTLASTLLIRSRVFTSAQQLILRSD